MSAPVRVSFDYTRSTGPVLGRFLEGLRDRTVVAGRTSDGRVITPPLEYDPISHGATTELVRVADTGTVSSWTWCPEPVEGQPLDRPFAWALVTLDGATEPMLHALDVSSPADVHTGQRVRIRWAEERTGVITDIACFEPSDTPPAPGMPQPFETLTARDAVTASGPGESTPTVITPVALDYVYAASPEESAFFRGLAEGRILGQRCPACDKVYVPPRGACPTDGVPTAEEVELSQRGTVTTFCVVNVPFLGQQIKPPYVSAYILLDGADIALQHLILDIPADEIRMGMRVEAVWKPRDEWGTTIENISHFRPTDEPDADYDTYKHHL
ncbi:Zn-ribbon domain-containing OB-fold protein [Nocardioides alcanivorans]|uniref:Zn-ribbon domain-containing OB-fold protein n=1 Tax=Nocardioides alcanivorans TaxID=2897352 RepID=UPI001F463C71|nr:OB-fold nucleic acid binding domain-containing protein [Nocardioides alcanivorans]